MIDVQLFGEVMKQQDELRAFKEIRENLDRVGGYSRDQWHDLMEKCDLVEDFLMYHQPEQPKHEPQILKTCPFCNSEAEVIDQGYCFTARCTKEGCSVELWGFSELEDAVSAWETRQGVNND